MPTTFQRLIRRPSPERGFTLIELLVVIIILGILAAVVVFAVNGVGDKGKSSATTIDERTIRTAEEAYCAQKGEYASGQALVDGGFLSELPEYHEVNARPNQGGPCNGWKYFILRTAAADPYPAGRWDPVATSGIAFTGYLVRLADGRVLAGGDNGSYAWITKIWDPTTNIWTTVGSPPDLPSGANTAILLTDDPLTSQNECKGAVVDNCGKVFLYGKYLYDPLYPAAGHPVEWERLPSPSTCGICNSGSSNFTSNFTYVQMKKSLGECGTNCGKIYIFPTNPRVVDVYNPTDNSYVTTPTNDPNTGVEYGSYANQLPDGRVLVCCRNGGDFSARATFLDPVSLTFIGDAAVPPSPWFAGSNPQPAPTLPNGDIFYALITNFPLESGVYSPQSGAWAAPGPAACALEDPYFCRPLGSLPDGRVLAIRASDTSSSNSVETYVYNPATSAWFRSGDLNNSLSYSGDAVLLDAVGGPCGAYCGKMLIAGEQSAEVYTP